LFALASLNLACRDHRPDVSATFTAIACMGFLLSSVSLFDLEHVRGLAIFRYPQIGRRHVGLAHARRLNSILSSTVNISRSIT
jgi:hypothetical protein